MAMGAVPYATPAFGAPLQFTDARPQQYQGRDQQLYSPPPQYADARPQHYAGLGQLSSSPPQYAPAYLPPKQQLALTAPPTAGGFCGNCGAPKAFRAKFCGNCGAAGDMA